ncbi:MAG: hypothetical protein LBI56_03840 [Puniceicoccales bacterium]|jgi:hypothetical protein|nr:hypothetical protein [Puniceicoccales bacterium]
MLAVCLIILYHLLLILMQIFNNIAPFPGILVVPIGLCIYFPAAYMRPLGATLLYCIVGLAFDSAFKFLPFGFTSIFCILFYCLQQSIANEVTTPMPSGRFALEHAVNTLYIFALFFFRGASFALYQFLLTVFLSHIFLMLVSNPMALAQQKIVSICNRHSKYYL